MKNKFIAILLIFILNLMSPSITIADEFIFNATEIKITENGNIVKGVGGGKVTTRNNQIILTANNFKYNKLTSLLEARGNVKLNDKNKNINIYTNEIHYLMNEEKIYTIGDTDINVEDEYYIEGNDIILFRNKMILSSDQKATITDNDSNFYELDKFLYSTKNKCENTKPIDCLRQFLDFADASNNNKLSRAELTRFSRFIVKWLSLKGELQLNESIGTAASTMFIGPALAELILRNYDYDNDGHIDIREITYDIVNITGSSELNQKIIRGYIEAIDIISKSKKDAVRILEDIF